MELIDPDLAGDERTLLTQFLDFQRAVLVRKAEGLAPEQLAATVGASKLTMAGLLKHMAWVEEHWFQVRLHGRPFGEPWTSAPWKDDRDWEFNSAVDDSLDELLELYETACEQSRAAVDEVSDLDAMEKKGSRSGDFMSLRWILLHMIEETARHLGHADLLRESIDGKTGD